MDNDLNENFKANFNDLVFENCIEGTLLRFIIIMEVLGLLLKNV